MPLSTLLPELPTSGGVHNNNNPYKRGRREGEEREDQEGAFPGGFRIVERVPDSGKSPSACSEGDRGRILRGQGGECTWSEGRHTRDRNFGRAGRGAKRPHQRGPGGLPRREAARPPVQGCPRSIGGRRQTTTWRRGVTTSSEGDDGGHTREVEFELRERLSQCGRPECRRTTEFRGTHSRHEEPTGERASAGVPRARRRRRDL